VKTSAGGGAAVELCSAIDPSQHGGCRRGELHVLPVLVRSLLGTRLLAREARLRSTTPSKSGINAAAPQPCFL